MITIHKDAELDAIYGEGTADKLKSLNCDFDGLVYADSDLITMSASTCTHRSSGSFRITIRYNLSVSECDGLDAEDYDYSDYKYLVESV